MTNHSVRLGKIHKSSIFEAQWKTISQKFPNPLQVNNSIQYAIRKYYGVSGIWHTDPANSNMAWCYINMKNVLYKIGMIDEMTDGRIHISLKEIHQVPLKNKPRHITPIVIDIL